jgi:uncharacterized membrane protein YbjE (DUF340 family)
MNSQAIVNKKSQIKIMFIVLAFMFTGIVAGYLLRSRKIRFQNGFILTLIWVLLFLLGLEVGMNDNVVRKFASLGFEAAVIAIAATFGSIVAAKLLWGRTPKSPSD